MIYGMWYGGTADQVPMPWRDLEQFDSLDMAIRAVDSRFHSKGKRELPFVYVDGRAQRYRTPSVTRESFMWIYNRDPRRDYDPWPDKQIGLDAAGVVYVEDI